jgi:6-pyruvoyltetrahydropterin/6-carboxytetrahydropterin synthase
MNIELIKTFHLEVAHRTTQGSERGERLHGHSLRVDVVCAGITTDPEGWLIDYGEIKTAFAPVKATLDHHDLNEVLGLEDVSLTQIRDYIHGQLAPHVAPLKEIHVAVEGDGAFVLRQLEQDNQLHLRERLHFSFEAAHRLPNVPEGHQCGRMHGHSFRVEAGAAHLEGLRLPLKALYEKVDHRCLNEIEGLENPTSEVLSQWIWQQLSAHVHDLRLVAVQETCTARCVYRG